MDVGAVMVESRHAAHQTGQHSHGVCIAAEATQEELHLLVDHGVLGHALFEFRLLRCVRQFTVQQQVAGFQEVAVLGQLFDGITTVQQLTLVAVDVPDWPYSLRISITSGPTVPWYTGSSTLGAPLLNDRVALLSASFISNFLL